VPVFCKVEDYILVVTVDGDFTPGELARKGSEALDSESLPGRVCVLLDVSGAAGTQTAEGTEMARVFVEHPTDVPRIAILGSFEPKGADGVDIKRFDRRAEALEWLKGDIWS